MNHTYRRKGSVILLSVAIAGVALVALLPALRLAEARRPQKPAAHEQHDAQYISQKADPVTLHATGEFSVQVTPDGENDKAPGSTLGRMLLSKQLHGDFEGTSKGQMLTVGTDVKGSGAYVAVERITGTLHGRSGSFALQHSGTMSAAGLFLNITIVPDSGSGQLTGIAGKMNITIANGKHSYDLEYTLPDAH
jgi:hypothetical protein